MYTHFIQIQIENNNKISIYSLKEVMFDNQPPIHFAY